jgi:ketosteroid isomerase-like protein
VLSTQAGSPESASYWLAMSRENVDLALLMCEFFNDRDLDRFLALMHDDVEIEPRVGALEGDHHGQKGVRLWWSNLLDVLPDYTTAVQELDDLGDMTLGQIRGTAHGAASDAPVVETWWQLIWWSDGKCVWWRNFATEAEARDAVRLEAR